jgi:hypothetical protein
MADDEIQRLSRSALGMDCGRVEERERLRKGKRHCERGHRMTAARAPKHSHESQSCARTMHLNFDPTLTTILSQSLYAGFSLDISLYAGCPTSKNQGILPILRRDF